MGKKIFTRDVISDENRALLNAKPEPKKQRVVILPARQEPKR
jgi:hypothetical protein